MVLLLKAATGSLNFKSRGSICRGGAGFTSAVVPPVYSRSCTCTNCTDGFVVTFSTKPTGSGRHFLSFLPALQRGTVLKNAIPCRGSNAGNVSNYGTLYSVGGKKNTRSTRSSLGPARRSLTEKSNGARTLGFENGFVVRPRRFFSVTNGVNPTYHDRVGDPNTNRGISTKLRPNHKVGYSYTSSDVQVKRSPYHRTPDITIYLCETPVGNLL